MAGGDVLQDIKLFETTSTLRDQSNQHMASVQSSSNAVNCSLKTTLVRQNGKARARITCVYIWYLEVHEMCYRSHREP